MPARISGGAGPTPKVRAHNKRRQGVVVVKTRARARAPRTIAEQAAQGRQRAKVKQAVREIKKPPPETGDILKGTRKVKAKRGGDAAKRELEGRGKAAGAARKVGEKAAKGHLGSAAFSSLIPGVDKLGANLVKDIINYPAQAIPSAYVPIAAAVEAVKGDDRRAKQIVKSIKEEDPVFAAGEGVVKGLSGDTRGAKKSLKRAVTKAKEHPGFTALEVAGLKGGAGRGVTRVQRAAGRHPTERAPATVPGTSLQQRREYSKDAFTRAGQKRRDRKSMARATRLRERARELEREDPGRHSDRIDELRDAALHGTAVRSEGELPVPGGAARRRDPSRMTDREIRKRASERVAVNEMVRRENRTKVGQEMTRAIAPRSGTFRPRSKPTAALTLHAQNIVDASPADLLAYRREIAARHEGLGAAGRKANRRLQRQIDRAVERHPGEAALKSQARAVARVIQPRTQKLVDRGMLPAASAEKAPLVPYAIRKMGATHGRAVTPPKSANAPVRVAKAQRARAERGVAVASRRAAREEGRTRLLTQQRTGRDLSTAKALDQQAKGLDEQATKLVALSRKNTMGKRATDPLADVGPLSKGQRRYRHKAARTGVRKQGVQVGSQGYRTGVRQARRAKELKARAESLRRDAQAIRDRKPGEQAQPAAALARLEQRQGELQLAELQRELARGEVKVAKRTARATRAQRRQPEELLDAEGRPLSTERIRAHMRERDIAEPSYVTQAPGRGGASAFFVSSHQAPSVPRTTRTGGATAKGTFEAHPDVLAEGAARAQGLIDAADGFAATVKEFAHKPTLGKLKTKRDADNAARELAADTGVEYRPIRLNPFAGREEQLSALLDQAGEGGVEQQLGHAQPVREALESAFKGDDGPGPWGLIPRAASDELAAHMQRMGAGPAAKTAQIVGQSFKRTVLATSLPWLAGNVAEASLRSALAGAGPRSYALGKKTLRAVDEISPLLGQELRARATGGGHFKSADTLHVRRGAEQFEGTVLQPLARGLHRFWETPGPRQAADVWNRWTDLTFRQVNGRVESAYQTAMLGRALRDSPLMEPGVPKLSAKAVDQAARGLTNTNEQAALGRAVERMYGKYGGFSAGTRWSIAMYTPFIPWTLNAAKFVADVLPRDHPVVTGLIAATEQWTEEWRKDHGLDLFMKGAVPGWLQGSIPLSGGRHQRAPHRYTPFGAFGDPLDTAAKAVLPQYQGVLAAFKGEDWKGAKLRNEDGSEMDTLGKSREAAKAFADATVPLLGIVKRVAEKGPGALDPLKATEPPKPKARATARTGRVQSVDAQIDAILSGGGAVDSYIDDILGGQAP